MYWLHILVIAPLWGMISAQLFLQGALAGLNFLIAVVGLLKRKVPFDVIAAALAVSLFSAVLFVSLLIFGIYLLRNYIVFGEGNAQTIIFWIFFVFSLMFMAEQVVAKTKRQWRNCTVEGSVELDILKRDFDNRR